MCFDNDYDWFADVYEEEVIEAVEPTRCDECRRTIPPGGWVRHIFMQEHEYCQECDTLEGDADRPENCDHSYGQTFEYDRCQACDQLIHAIHAREIEEGCGEHESRPALEELYEAMHYGDGPAYLKKAEEMYPGITARLPKSFVRSRDRDED